MLFLYIKSVYIYRNRRGGGANACYAFLRGDCDRGDSCKFSHTTESDSNNWGGGRGGFENRGGGGFGDRNSGRGVCFAFQKVAIMYFKR